MTDLLNLNHVSYTYHTKAGDVHAVRDVNDAFGAGKIYAIVGSSGSGKSTLLALCAGLILPESGKISYRGQSLSALDRDQYRREEAGMIFQSFYLLPQLSARENVELSLDLCNYRGDHRARALDLLGRVGLSAFHAGKRPARLSGGEQQRVAIARALAPDPQVIFADEPTGSLDAENSRKIIDLLSDLAHDAGKCVIVITHAAEIAERCDAVLRMRDGELVG